ncbi:tyrosyl-DNA phosphodiesterase 1-like isoform X1 [Achlya hypogyna]|uniref:Tyrosyl-DNA phosphodiesterase 1-like isoform X1 n=1 Tax=Achlya hypogyna TaxID=1202772 RepID=A0A1V9Y5P7_ACHHY|nr:tyrosyl-DNA phosphodiesterase 1-like isoform X1 [Achlya hypogyna]
MATDERPAKRVKAAPATALGFRLTTLQNPSKGANRDCISLPEVLAGDFSHAILTNYHVDVAWLLAQSKQLTKVPVLLCHGSNQSSIRDACAPYANVTALAPPLPIPYGTHHTKMAVLFHATFVRVAVFTANFLAGDWATKTQGLWFQDFPRQPASAPKLAPQLTPSAPAEGNTFEHDLTSYLSTLHRAVATLCKEMLPLYDYSGATVVLIPSVPGVYTAPEAMERYGHLRLQKVLRDRKVPVLPSSIVVAQVLLLSKTFSSLGSLTESWLQEFLSSWTLSRPSNLPPPKGFHIVWPSVAAVRGSLEGWASGGALPCPLKNLKPFLHKYLRTWDPPEALQRTRAMPHIKTFARLGATGTPDVVLLTSANLSQAAWGAYQKQRSQFVVRSYELGVLFLSTPATTLGFADDATAGLCFPLPYKWPPTTYNVRTEEPWSWDQVRDDVDDFGQTYEPR